MESINTSPQPSPKEREIKTELKPQRKALYQEIYNAAKFTLEPYFRHDSEAVKARRDAYTFENFGKGYDELTDHELMICIHNMRVDSGMDDPDDKKDLASHNQLQLLRYYALSCALVYCNLEGYKWIDNEDGESYSGEHLREYIKKRFEENDNYLHMTLYIYLHNNWINRHSHRFLIEGGFKKFAKNESNFHYEYLKPKEAQYLIKRYGEIFQTLKKGERVQLEIINN
jgi:hypothetical protein